MVVKSHRKLAPPTAPQALDVPVGPAESTPKIVLPAALRVRQIVKPDGILPIAASTWWAGVKNGRYPAPIRLGPRVTVWRREDVLALLDRDAV